VGCDVDADGYCDSEIHRQANDVAENRPLWRLMSKFGAMLS